MNASGPDNRYCEHSLDVLEALQRWQAQRRRCALAIITSTRGGAVRKAGALMAVADDGAHAGYVSGGCIDRDVVLQAVECATTRRVTHLTYGAGSPFVDMPLPCGGTIEIMIIPEPEQGVVVGAIERLRRREPVRFCVARSGAMTLIEGIGESGWAGDTFIAFCAPKLRLRIAGRGVEAMALARVASASGIEVRLQTASDADTGWAREAGFAVSRLNSPSSLDAIDDDAWTAFVMMFHDAGWETALLKQALAGPCFFLGAVGSRRTHARRCDALREAGCPEHQIARVRGPIGLAPAMRDASMLAISALAEVIREFNRPNLAERRGTALVLLAAGASSRYGAADKLLADLGGQPVLSYAARCFAGESFGARIAVTAPGQEARQAILRSHGWTLVENAEAASGQASSLRAGIGLAASDPALSQALILLSDMPFVPEAHLHALLASEAEAAMTDAGGVLLPPALFKRAQFEALRGLSGDRGAKSIFELLARKKTIALDPQLAIDIDEHLDLAHASRALESMRKAEKQ